jgi:ketosteroid isomerase-like protein
MSHDSLEVVRRGYEYFLAHGDFSEEFVASGFVWDMSKFDGWPEEQVYEGIEGARRFIREWTGAWDDWTIEIDAFHEVGEQVVVVTRQSGRSKATGMEVEMHFAQVWTVRHGREVRMEMYSDPSRALKAVGLEP